MTNVSDSRADGGPWLPGAAPRPGHLARACIRSAADIRQIEAFEPAEVLPAPTIYECIRTSAAEAPSKAAIVHLLSADPEVAPRRVTYEQLVDSIERAASLFHAVSSPRPASVSIILPMVPEALIAAWAGATAGIANPINPYLEPEHIVALMNASQASVLVVGCAAHGRGAWDRIDRITQHVPTLRAIFVVDSADERTDFIAAIKRRPPGLSFTPSRDAQREATYLPTGGTTAAPKLVRMTHRGQLLDAWLAGAHAGSERDDVVGHAMPNFHVGGANMLTLRAVLFGQTVVTLTIDGFRNPDVVNGFWGIVRKHGITSLIATPTTAAALLAQPHADAGGHSIETFNCGGSTIPVDVLRGFHARFGIWLREIWGMSEFHGFASMHPNPDAEPAIGSVGRAVPWSRVRVVEVDSDNRFVRDCAPGERGALIVSSAMTMPGYVDARFDAGFFVTDVPDGDRWGNTGDLGTMDAEGHVWISGRAKDVIIRGGHNLDPRTIEDALQRHPAVQLAAAIGKPDAAKGELPIAYVQLKAGGRATPEELIAICREHVAERAAVPVQVFIIESLPLTAVGKLNKPVLRREATLWVAREQARAVVGDRGAITITVDESSVRLRVHLSVATTCDPQSLEEELRAAFASFEFETIVHLQHAEPST